MPASKENLVTDYGRLDVLTLPAHLGSSVQFFFPTACRKQNHLYHGRQVNNQVPPL